MNRPKKRPGERRRSDLSFRKNEGVVEKSFRIVTLRVFDHEFRFSCQKNNVKYIPDIVLGYPAGDSIDATFIYEDAECLSNSQKEEIDDPFTTFSPPPEAGKSAIVNRLKGEKIIQNKPSRKPTGKDLTPVETSLKFDWRRPKIFVEIDEHIRAKSMTAWSVMNEDPKFQNFPITLASTILSQNVNDDPARAHEVRAISIRNYRLDDLLFEAILNTLTVTNCITIINFWNVGLTEELVARLAETLFTLPAIKTLSLDDNPLVEPNFHLLIAREHSNIETLSLRFCNLNHEAVAPLFEELGSVKGQNLQLTLLNLSNNVIGDVGCRRLAEALCYNRKLGSISLSSNRITDQGIEYLYPSLTRFEISRGLQVHIRQLRQKLHSNKPLIEIVDEEEKTRKPSKTRNKKEKMKLLEKKSKINHLPKTISYLATQSIDEDPIEHDNILKGAHPICDRTLNKVFLDGNRQLYYLNFEGNNITAEGLKILHDIIEYQYAHSVHIDECGLRYIVVEDKSDDKLYSEKHQLITTILHTKILHINNSTE